MEIIDSVPWYDVDKVLTMLKKIKDSNIITKHAEMHVVIDTRDVYCRAWNIRGYVNTDELIELQNNDIEKADSCKLHILRREKDAITIEQLEDLLGTIRTNKWKWVYNWDFKYIQFQVDLSKPNTIYLCKHDDSPTTLKDVLQQNKY